MGPLIEALNKSREGDVRGAIEILERTDALSPDARSFLYMLKQRAGDDVMSLIETSIEWADGPLATSTWQLRKASAALASGDRAAALAAAQAVLKIGVNDDHTHQANKLLLEIAGL